MKITTCEVLAWRNYTNCTEANTAEEHLLAADAHGEHSELGYRAQLQDRENRTAWCGLHDRAAIAHMCAAEQAAAAVGCVVATLGSGPTLVMPLERAREWYTTHPRGPSIQVYQNGRWVSLEEGTAT